MAFPPQNGARTAHIRTNSAVVDFQDQQQQQPLPPQPYPLFRQPDDDYRTQLNQSNRPPHMPQDSFGGETYHGESSRSSFDESPETFQDLEKSRSITSLTALTPNRAMFAQSDEEQLPPGKPTGETIDPYSPTRPKLGIKQRLAHFTWAWYTLVMSTGGLSLLIISQPHQFPGLREIGLVVYIINVILFTLVTSALLARFFLFPGTFKKSITHPREGFFFPTFFLSLATLITSTQRYAVPTNAADASPGLLWAIQAAFWLYLALTTLVAVGQYSYVFAAHTHGLQTMMPTWILPIFPIMLSGTIAAVIAGSQPPTQAVPIIMAGLTCQGLGLAVAVMMYAHMVGRLMQSGLPNREHRPGLFMCVGPPAFTALAFLGLAQALPPNFDHDMDGLLDTSIIRTAAIMGAGFLWALSFWWFGIAVLAVLQSPPRYFHLGWWATVFPNTGFTLATISLGKAFQNEPVLWFATAMSICLLLTYSFVLYSHVQAVLVQDIMYPARDEDFEDH